MLVPIETRLRLRAFAYACEHISFNLSQYNNNKVSLYFRKDTSYSVNILIDTVDSFQNISTFRYSTVNLIE